MFNLRYWFFFTNYALDRRTTEALLLENFQFMMDVLFGNVTRALSPSNVTFMSAKAHATDILRLKHHL